MGTPPVVAVLEAVPPDLASRIRALAGEGLDLRFPVTNSEGDRAATLRDADYAVVRGVRMPPELLAAAPRLRLIHQWGTGTDHLPLTAAHLRGIAVARSPGRNAPSVADMTLGLMLAALRRIPQGDARIRGGLWADAALWEEGRDLAGATVGLVGFGAIGRLVAQRLAGFDATVLYTRPSGHEPGVPGFLPLAELLSRAEILSLHLPLTPVTRRLLGATEIARLPRGAVLVNTARGELADEGAIADALRSGQLGAAALDAFAEEPLPPESPLLSAPNLILSAHVAGRTRDNLARMVRHWASNLRTHAEGRPLDPGDLVLPPGTVPADLP